MEILPLLITQPFHMEVNADLYVVEGPLETRPGGRIVHSCIVNANQLRLIYYCIV